VCDGFGGALEGQRFGAAEATRDCGGNKGGSGVTLTAHPHPPPHPHTPTPTNTPTPTPPTPPQVVIDYFNSRLDATSTSAPGGKGGELTTAVRPQSSQPDWSVKQVGRRRRTARGWVGDLLMASARVGGSGRPRAQGGGAGPAAVCTAPPPPLTPG
jgi:hypothetical protein